MGKRIQDRPPHEDELIRSLHKRAVSGDTAALEELARHVLKPLTHRLHAAYRRAPADLIWDACVDAILEYGSHPDRFDATRGVPLDRFIQGAAARNLANLLEADARRRERETQFSRQRLDLISWPTLGAGDEGTRFRRRILALADGSERKALVAWLNGERTPQVAAALGLSHLPEADQRREVKRFKDRFLRRVSRQVEKSCRRK